MTEDSTSESGETRAEGVQESHTLGRVLREVEMDWAQGWIALQTVKRYRRGRESEQALTASWLHQMAFLACERFATPTAARLTEANRQSLSIVKLLNVAATNSARLNQDVTMPEGRTPPETSSSDVLAFVEESRAALDDHQDAITRIRYHRDKTLAHLDRVKLSKPQHLAEQSVELAELEGVYLALRQILEGMRRIYDNSEFVISNIEADLDRELDLMLAAYLALWEKFEVEREAQRRAGPWA